MERTADEWAVREADNLYGIGSAAGGCGGIVTEEEKEDAGQSPVGGDEVYGGRPSGIGAPRTG